MAFCWRANNGPTLNAGLVAVIFEGIRTIIAMKAYIVVMLLFFIWGGWFGPSVHPSRPAYGVPTIVLAYMANNYSRGMSLLVTVKVLHIRGILYYNCYMCWEINWSIYFAFLCLLMPHVLVPSADNLCNPFEPDQARRHLGPYLYPNYLTMK